MPLQFVQYLAVFVQRSVMQRAGMLAREDLFKCKTALIERAHIGESEQRFVEHAAAAHLGGILFEVTDPTALRACDTARIGLEFLSDELEQGRFAGAIKPDKTNASIVWNRPAYMVEDHSPAKRLRDVIERQHLILSDSSCHRCNVFYRTYLDDAAEGGAPEGAVKAKIQQAA